MRDDFKAIEVRHKRLAGYIRNAIEKIMLGDMQVPCDGGYYRKCAITKRKVRGTTQYTATLKLPNGETFTWNFTIDGAGSASETTGG